jgi:hypothetical protein
MAEERARGESSAAMREIPLTRDQVAIVDDEDYAWLSQWKWQATWNPHTRSFYATTDRMYGMKRFKCSMHREILGLTDMHVKCDHRNHDTLDNRRRNLRVASNSQNLMNSRMRTSNTSGYKGVSWFARDHKWRAKIMIGYKQRSLGHFDKIEDAAAAYHAASLKYHGEFACRKEAEAKEHPAA